jgi:hypothetical protein
MPTRQRSIFVQSIQPRHVVKRQSADILRCEPEGLLANTATRHGESPDELHIERIANRPQRPELSAHKVSYYKAGYYSKALEAWNQACDLARPAIGGSRHRRDGIYAGSSKSEAFFLGSPDCVIVARFR